MSAQLRSFRIPPLALLATVFLLAVGELACGTGLYFVAMMAITLLSIGTTYNMLGGLSRFSGFLFAAIAAGTIVISQFAKVLLFESAEQNLEVPHLTITVYAIYYVSAMIGVFLFGWLRLRLPKPLEPNSAAQTRVLYWIAFVVGVVANTILWIDTWRDVQSVTSTSHSISLAFSPLLLFCVVLAVDKRIRETEGKHSLSIWVILPALGIDFFQYVLTSREGLASPVFVYLLACYVRGFRFKARHYIGMLAFVVLFMAVISPFEIYSRSQMSNTLSFEERLARGYSLLESPPSWHQVWNAQANAETYSRADEYYSHSGTFVLSRFSMIRADSDLIAACASGFHYGLEGLKLDLLGNVPRILYRNKPDVDSGWFVEGIVGNGTKWAFTSISDSFGAFSWVGVVVFPLLVLPWVFVVYDSLFDMSRPWGTAALGMVTLRIWGGSMGVILTALIRDPISIWFLSLLTVGAARITASHGPSAFKAETSNFTAYPPAKPLS